MQADFKSSDGVTAKSRTLQRLKLSFKRIQSKSHADYV